MAKNEASNFKVLYKEYESKHKTRYLKNDIRIEAETMICEREFVKWLKIKYPKKITSETYQKSYTYKLFNEFMIAFKKNRYSKKIQIIIASLEEQLSLDQKFPETEKHTYDVDLVEEYLKNKKLVESLPPDEQIRKGIYLEIILSQIKSSCEEKQQPLNRVLDIGYPILVDNSMFNFGFYLGIKLMNLAIHKIEALLNYQNALWKHELIFPTFIEHSVCRIVEKFSLVYNGQRLLKIMDWVEKNRKFISQEEADRYIDPPSYIFFYWPYPEEKLDQLYKSLVLNKKIDENNLFSDSFRKNDPAAKNVTVWKSSSIELMYLLYLIYNKNSHHYSLPLHDIGCILFKKESNNFDKKVLNTIFNQLIKKIKAKDKLSLNLITIEDIVAKLKLK